MLIQFKCYFNINLVSWHLFGICIALSFSQRKQDVWLSRQRQSSKWLWCGISFTQSQRRIRDTSDTQGSGLSNMSWHILECLLCSFTYRSCIICRVCRIWSWHRAALTRQCTDGLSESHKPPAVPSQASKGLGTTGWETLFNRIAIT